ncbi:MAG: SCO6880 family protein [Solirubrobacteraceae bacterium]
MAAVSERLSYRFGPLERRGILGPVRVGQAATIAVGAVLAIAILDRAATATGAVLATITFGTLVVIAVAPVGRRTAEEWAPVIAAFALRRLLGRHRFRSGLPTRGLVADERSAPGRRMIAQPRPDVPRELHGVSIAEVDYRDRSIGVICEQRGRRLTAVLACRVVAFSLLDPEAQERRLARWGLVLAGAAGTSVRRLQWIERTAPAQGDELARWLQSARDPAVPPRGTAMIESYLELIDATTKVTQDHEILVAVQVDGRLRERAASSASEALVEQTERIAQGLEATEVTVLGALSAGQIARTLRTAFDPYCRTELAGLEAADRNRLGLEPANAWPLGGREAWDHYHSDGAVHATYWVGAWPRVDVSPMFMDALLSHSNAVRTVAVTFEPISPERSTREVEAAVTRDRADHDLRLRFGQSETARQRQAEESTLRREAELAAGHGEVRLAGFVTVSGRDPDDLRRGCTEVHEHAARARLELHRMYGQQADAFTFTLPLCRGLR